MHDTECSAVFDLPVPGMDWFDESEREPARDVAGSTLVGEQIALADFRGDFLVVNVWESWRAPCRDEGTRPYAAVSRNARRPGCDSWVSIPATTRPQRAFVRKYGIEYPSLYDPDGSLIVEFNGGIPINAGPSTIVVGAAGRVAARVVGKVTFAMLRDLVVDVRSGTSKDDSSSSSGVRQ